MVSSSRSHPVLGDWKLHPKSNSAIDFDANAANPLFLAFLMQG
jgi:hypothetical protein